jgi:hypothetical protein
MHVKPAEQITGEEWEFQFFDPVGPPPLGAIERKELFIALPAQGVGSDTSQSGLDLNGVPRQIVRLR